MWASAQRDGRPAEYRWRPLFNAGKFRWRPILECRAVTLPRRETRWNLQGCPKLANRSQPLVGRSSPYYGDIWRRYCCLRSLLPIVDTCLSCEDIARQSCTMVPRWRLAIFCVLYFQRTARNSFQTCILNSHAKATPCVESRSMVDIQSPTAGIRRKKERKKKPHDENIWPALLHVRP